MSLSPLLYPTGKLLMSALSRKVYYKFSIMSLQKQASETVIKWEGEGVHYSPACHSLLPLLSLEAGLAGGLGWLCGCGEPSLSLLLSPLLSPNMPLPATTAF